MKIASRATVWAPLPYGLVCTSPVVLMFVFCKLDQHGV